LEDADVVFVVDLDALRHGGGNDSGQLGDGFPLRCCEECWLLVCCFVGFLSWYPGFYGLVVDFLC